MKNQVFTELYRLVTLGCMIGFGFGIRLIDSNTISFEDIKRVTV
jgi:hypothetical protein